MAFIGPMRQMESRGIAGVRFQGFVVKNDDSDVKDEKSRKQQRIKVRIPDLHDDIKDDDDLPWFSTGNLPSYSGSSNIGDHGPIPPIGTKVWVSFSDDTQYHGHYIGAVQNEKTKIPEFTDKKSEYSQSYPHAHGSVDQSGTFHAVDTKRDVREHTHVTGTAHHIDGKGNVNVVINGDVERKDNKDAAKKFAKGLTMAVFGDISLYVSGNIKFEVKGDTEIVTKGKTNIASKGDCKVQSKGKMDVIAEGECKVSSKKKLTIVSEKELQLVAPKIQSSTPIKLGGSGEAGKAEADVKDREAPKPRGRPKMDKVKNPPSDTSSAGKVSGGK